MEDKITTPEFDKTLQEAQKKYIALGAAAGTAFIATWIISQKGDTEPLLNIEALKIPMQYLSLIITGFGIWYGSSNYDKTAALLKEKDDIHEKQTYYLKAVKFRNILTYIPLVINILLYFVVDNNSLYYLAAAISALFAWMALPTAAKFESDFFKEIIIEEEEESDEEQPQTENKKEE
ncbi:MAG: hypothetical protein MJZ66_03085 [Bacteroidales bacterium]|nr:hypothetical protein [Bacteroidales bacterium]